MNSGPAMSIGRVAQLVRALLSHSRGPGFESLRDHSNLNSNPFADAINLKLRWSLIVVLFAAATLPAVAQQPTAEQAKQMLQANPALLDQLKQRILSSGLTPDQVRARLRAEGYPENLLDAYLPGATGAADSTVSTSEVFSALTKLGI